MKKLLLSLMAIITLGCTSRSDKPANVSLKDAVQDKFLIGAAMNMKQINGIDTMSVDIVKHHFNSIVAENCMKSAPMQPKKGEFNFENADKFVSFGEENDMFIVGHTLIWHQQAPKWFFVDDNGKDVSRDELIARMKNHISTIVGRYKGRVHGWDVVNEALEDNGEWRRTKFYEIIGEDYIRLAFEFAREADPDAELYYNDYSMAKQGRRDAVVNMINDLRKQGVEIDGIGMQGHLSMTYPPIDEFEKSLVAFSQAGVKVMITELDLGVLPGGQGADLTLNYAYDKVMNPYVDSLPQSVATAWQARYADFFRLFMKHSDKISRVTLWGVGDSMSWRNNWPVRGRTDYPLLFDRNYEAKPIVKEIIDMAQAIQQEQR